MSYLVQSVIAENVAMNKRVAQCAAEQGLPLPPPEGSPHYLSSPDQWAADNRRYWSAAPGWADAWASSLASHAGNSAYDPGIDEAVITDAMILSQVQSMVPTPA